MRFDVSKWEPVPTKPVNTLQIFITNVCNKRCRGCFYADRLGRGHMSFEDYQIEVGKWAMFIDKVILLGGEPTLNPVLPDMLDFNDDIGLRTTVYTNGYKVKNLLPFRWPSTTMRAGVLGLHRSEKPLDQVEFLVPMDVVYMLRRDNLDELNDSVKYAEEHGCRRFMISSIRDIAATGSFWKDTDETVPNQEYLKIVENFLDEYDGVMDIHIAGRGVIDLDRSCDSCRFLNIFPDGRQVVCPFDISTLADEPFPGFGERECNKSSQCILQKLVLKRKSQ